MQQVKNFSRRSFLLAMIIVAGLFAFGGGTIQASNLKPYEYTFIKDETTIQTFNGVNGIKKLNVTFDQPIPVTVVPLSDVSVVASTEKRGEAPVANIIDIVDRIEISGKTLSIHFKNLDYIDYTDTSKSYKLIIKSGAGLYLGQSGDLEFPFAVYDLLPGFETVFLAQGAEGTGQINRIFEENAPRDIFVHIPKYYLNKIETIHRYKGVVSEKEASTLTNIDVLTDNAVSRLKVGLNNNLIRDLEPHPSVKGFTLGYANDQALEVDDLEEFSLKAYDVYGRILDSTTFKINYIDEAYLDNTRIKVSNYITKKASDFGKTYTLYDLMSKPKIFENILTGLSVEDLNKLGVTYANQFSTVQVNDLAQLEMALANAKIKTINLTSNIPLSRQLLIDRDVTINGTSNAQIAGDIRLGDGSKNLNIKLNNIGITGTLTVDAGSGNVILENVTANVLDVISGGVNSIHLINFTATNGIVFNNIAPVRLVLTNSNKQNVTLASDKEVILEGAYGTIASTNQDAKLTVKHNVSIDSWSIGAGMKLTVTHPESVTLPAYTGAGVLEKINTGETGPGEENNLGTVLGEIALDYNWDDSELGKEIEFDQLNTESKTIAENVQDWKIDDTNLEASIRNNRILVINNLSEEYVGKTLKVTLKGTYEEKQYSIIMNVTIN
ncbi:pectate lyase-like adhesive domain-containing protein [Solibacillus sp. FSL K6-1554]|uniref:pectate lyase-like adhesive domain-containing protein n=1 Tax=Solibacillus sp. FSL K6-1554 TaxID=2921472 RepID=UPI0030FC14BD